MKGYGPETFGALNAATYDERHDPGTTDQAVEFLAALAEGDRVLEFAIGTGRVALPLAARGLQVAGIEASPLMVEKMRAKPGGADIPVIIGDMAVAKMEGVFDLAFLIFNTLFNLTTQEAQQQCFENAAAHLRSGGRFVIETYVPDLSAFKNDTSFQTRKQDEEAVVLEAAAHDAEAQRINYQYIRIDRAGVQLTPLPIRYAVPDEIDQMAARAGFDLEDRFGSWGCAPFTADRDMHVSVYKKR